MTERCTLRPTKHAKNQMVKRGISKDEILEAILKGAKKIDGMKIVALFRKLEVVYIQKPCQYFVITPYWR